MRSKSDRRPIEVLRRFGSLWLGRALLVIILVAMACATVFEKSHGTEQALALFYKSWWFKLFLLCLAINVGIAVFTRLPFSQKQIGFVLTHASVLVILVGALVSEYMAVEGTIGMDEGDTVKHYTVVQDTLFLRKRGEKAEATVDITGLPAKGVLPTDHPQTEPLGLDDVSVEVVRYVPDSRVQQELTNDGRLPRLGAEATISDPDTGREASTFLFADRPTGLGGIATELRSVDAEELQRLIDNAARPPDEQSQTLGSLRIEHEGKTFEFPVEDCMQEAVAVGETGFTVKVLRYLPHAIVGPDRKIENLSNEPRNPALEVEVTGPEGTVRSHAFANVHNLQAMHGTRDSANPHGAQDSAELKVVFSASEDLVPSAPISLLAGPENKLHVRFALEGQPVVVEELTLGKPCETPFEGFQLTVHRRVDRALVKRTVIPLEKGREGRVAAVQLHVRSPAGTQGVWLQKGDRRSFMANGAIYDLEYANKQVPLGFSVTLQSAEVGFYPGTGEKASYESLIRIVDPGASKKISRMVSMNNPVKYGGYTFSQSNMGQRGGWTFLGVSSDPGEPIVFIGYCGLMVGMLMVLWRRIADHRAASAGALRADEAKSGRPTPDSAGN